MQGAALVVDSTLANQESAARRIQQAVDSGRKVRIDYLYADPPTAWRRVEERRLRTGRPVPLDDFVASHIKSLVTTLSLADRYATDPRIELKYVDNTGARGDIHHVPKAQLFEKLVAKNQI